MNVHYSKELINNIRQTDMVEFLEKRNSFSFKKQGTDFRCKEHSSLVIKGDKYRWFWNSKAIGGSGVINYLMKIENTTFPEAIVAAQSIICMPTAFSQTPELRNRAIFSLPEKEKLSPSKLIRYLCEIRGINHNIVSHLIEEMSIGQTLSSLSPRPTPCKQLSLHTAFYGKKFFIANVVVHKVRNVFILIRAVKLASVRRLFAIC